MTDGPDLDSLAVLQWIQRRDGLLSPAWLKDVVVDRLRTRPGRSTINVIVRSTPPFEIPMDLHGCLVRIVKHADFHDDTPVTDGSYR